MRQVPPIAGTPAHHLLIGSGKLTQHFSRYFELLGLSFEVWREPRTFAPDRAAGFSGTHVWLLVSDRAIADVARRFRGARVGVAGGVAPTLLHASGATVVEGVLGAHPLMTFGPELYPLEAYRRIPFVIENPFDGRSPGDLLGGLPNTAVFLDPERRALYHSLVSASGNFPALLWAEVFELFERRLGLPHELLAPFLFQTLTNVLRQGELSLTGPLVRGDRQTVRAHREALAETPLSDLYVAFEKFFADRTAHPPGPGPKGNDHVL